MLASICLFALLSAAPPAPAGAPAHLALLPFKTVGVSDNLAAFYGEHAAQKLRAAGFDVVTSDDVATLVGVERQKQLLGCSDQSTSCMAELANAMGADLLMTGEIARLDGTFHVNLKVLDARTSKAKAWFAGEASGENALLQTLDSGVASLEAQLRGGPPASAEVTSAPGVSDGGPRRYAWIPAVAGVALAGAGTALLLDASAQDARLRGDQPLADPRAVAADGALKQDLARGAFAVGGVALATAAAMFLWPHDGARPGATVLLTPEGAAVGIAGRLP